MVSISDEFTHLFSTQILEVHIRWAIIIEKNDATADLRKAVSFSFDRQFLSQSRANRLCPTGYRREWLQLWTPKETRQLFISGILVAYRVRYVLVEPLDIINNESPSLSNGQPYLRMTEKNVTRLHFQTTAGEHLFGVKYEFRVAAVSSTGIGPEVSDRIAVPEADYFWTL
ncbi:LOW QUALITY PROTEIN: hypothetical protein T265_13846 [Opisthorchis viverrini]|uniref:Uncharacterized protein n=1 Tax=Opisthorchis viverrini TaxID=6198 RepID=A0A075AEW5_OPIVI|nr:LOW QUALITY PROTEIN: hypothetical protein T265_13846 [Opisthorchis viverrini]KER27129.1 LOW QUALITY PROTEIN: hypothetical protein T265_13846 [Opisthorchis viverrini]